MRKSALQRIRMQLLAGNVAELPALLGHSYEIKADYDGSELIIEPYYTLPASGKYAVILSNGRTSMETELMVKERKLMSIEGIPLSLKGKLSIVWNSRISEQQIVSAIS